MISDPSLLGVVLAGGESRRFGRDKASASVAGESLVDRAGRTLSSLFDDVVVVTSKRPLDGSHWRHVPDLRPGLGPLGGLEAALVTADSEGHDGVFVLACDLPLVSGEVVRSVVGALGTADAAAPKREGHPGCEPLCAAYRCSCLPAVRELLDRQELAVHGVVARVDSVFVDVSPESFLNVNTPADRARAEEILGAQTS